MNLCKDNVHARTFFFFFGMRCSLQDLSSPARDQTWALAVKVVSPNHWTTTEFPMQEHLNEENLKCYKDLKYEPMERRLLLNSDIKINIIDIIIKMSVLHKLT